MNKNEILTLIHFNFWANDRVLTACEQLSTDEFTRGQTPDPGWGSLRGILVHTLDAEYGWRALLQGRNWPEFLQAEDFADVASLKVLWDRERAAWFDYAANLREDSIQHGYGDDPQTSLKAWQTVIHVVTHGIQHRGEAAAILTGYGQSPGELDFDVFLEENPN